jgi:hypothetical protein
MRESLFLNYQRGSGLVNITMQTERQEIQAAVRVREIFTSSI